MSVPSAPNIWVRPLATSGQLEFWWQPPAQTGGSPITYYQLNCPQISLTENYSSNVYETRITRLTNHAEYQFTLAAANAYGLGPTSSFTSVQPGNKAKSNYISSFTMMNASTAMLKWSFSTNQDEGATKWFVVNAVPSSTANSTILITTSISSYSTVLANLVKDTYACQVFAVNDSGWQYENTAPLIVDTTLQSLAPTAPTNVTTSNISQSSVTVSWTGAIRVAYYTFSLNNGTTIPKIYNAGTNLATFTDLSNNMYYQLNVNAVNNIGTSKSENYLFQTLAVQPTTPYALILASRTSTSMVIQWSGGVNATSFSFLLNNAPVVPTYLDVTQNTATFTNLSVNTTYNVVVTATNSGGSLSSKPGVFTTLPNQPTQISSMAVTSVNYSSFSIEWAGAQGASSYVYTLNNISTIPYTQSVQDQTALFTNLSSNTVYSTIIFAINEGGNSISNPLAVRTYLPPITSPSSLAVSTGSVSQSSFTVNWRSGDLAQSAVFNVNGTNVSPGIYSLSTKTATFINLATSTNYSLFLTVSNETDSATTSTLTTQTLIAPPEQPYSIEATALGPTAFSIVWFGGLLASTFTFTLNGTLTTPASYSYANKTASFTGLVAATNYNVVVIATNPSGTLSSQPTLITTHVAAPSQPTSVTSSLIKNTGFTITWSGAANATSFSFTLNGASTTPTSYSFGSKSATFTGLVSGSSYNVIVIATNMTGSTNSNTLAVTTTQAPSQPINITASAVSNTGFTISWSGGVGATSYTYSLDGLIITPSSQSVGSATATFTGLTQFTEYDTIVTAVNASGSTSSVIVAITTASTGTPPQTPLPTVPGNISSSNISSSAFTINWTEGVGTTAYVFTLNGSSTAPSVYSIEGKTATFTNLTMTSSYSVVIIASNSAGSVTSSPVVVNTTTVAPSQPINIIPSGITQTAFTITWSGGEVATSYSYTLNSNVASPSSSSVANKTATFTSLTINTTYTIIVTATNAGGSTVSNPIYITLTTGPPTLPSSITSNNISPIAFNIAWLSGDIATSNTFTLNGIPTDPVIYNLTGKTANFTNLLPSTTYYVGVNAINNSGLTTSAYSPSQISGLQVWLDGSDPLASGAKPANNAILPGWYDKSGNNNNGTAVNSPTFNNNKIEFNGSSYFTLPNGAIPFNNTSYSIFVVATFTDNNIHGLFGSGAASQSQSINIRNQGNNIYTYWYLNDILTSGTFTSNSPFLYESLYLSGNSRTVYLSGASSGADIPAPRNQPNTNNTLGLTVAGEYMYGTISEFLVFNTNLSTIDRQNVEGYLAWKWSLQATLPSNHPYYAVSPKSGTPITTLQAKPTKPINISFSTITPSSFTALWQQGDVANSNQFYLNSTLTTPSSYSLTNKVAYFNNLTQNTTYGFIVTASNSFDYTASATYEVATPITVPSQPTGLTSSAIKTNSFIVSWTDANTSLYYVYTLNGLQTVPASQSVAGKTATFTGLNTNTGYTVTITGFNQSGASPTSAPLTVTTISLLPNQPTTLTSYNITSSGFSISWYNGDPASSYSFTLNGTTVIPQTYSFSQKTATFTGLNSFTQYSVIVIPVNKDGQTNSPVLNVRTLLPGPLRPYNLTTAPINGSQFYLYWSGGNAATSYSFTIDKNPVTASSVSLVSSVAVLTRPSVDPRFIAGLKVWLDASDPLNNGGSIPGSTPITPLFVPGCVMWLDASDPLNTGITPANGTTITTWYDKTFRNHNAQSVKSPK